MKVVFLINNCNIGGAQYVAHIQAIIAVKAGIRTVVLAGTHGFFFDKMVAAGAEVHYAGHLNEPYSDKNLKWVENYVRNADVVFNCIWQHMNWYIRKLKFSHKFRFMNVIHSNVDYAINMVKQYSDIIDRQYVIHEKIKDALLAARFPKEKIWVIHNVIDMDNIVERCQEKSKKIRKDLKIKSGDLVLGIVTRINTDKNVLDTIRLLYRLVRVCGKKFVLIIIGEPSTFRTSMAYYKKLVEYVKDKHLGERVRLLGGMSTEDVYKIQPVFDIAINVSPSEGLPISLLEQMAAGIHCVYPGVGDIPGVLGMDGSRGKVIDIKQRKREVDIHKYFNYSDEEIQLFVDHICSLDAEKINETGKAAREWILENRNMEKHTEAFLDFIGFNDPDINKELYFENLRLPCFTGNPDHVPAVSVLMTVKDTPLDWLRESVWSVLSQTYKNWEFIIVDDSGTQFDDGDSYSLKIISLCEKHGIIYVSTGGNLGVGPASNVGLSVCRGNWIARVDSDDIVMSNWLEKQIKFIEHNPEARVVGCQLRAFDQANWVSAHKVKRDARSVLNSPKGHSWIINHGGVLIHHETLISIGGYSIEKNRRGQDFDLWIEFLKAGYALYTNQSVLYLYRIWKKTNIEAWWDDYAKKRIQELTLLNASADVKQVPAEIESETKKVSEVKVRKPRKKKPIQEI